DTSTPTQPSTPTNTPTVTDTPTPTNTGVPTATNTSTNTPTNTATVTNTNTATLTPTDTPNNTFTSTNTATNTTTVTATNTPTATPTNTRTATNTATVTNTRTNTNTATNTSTNTATVTTTNTATVTATWTASNTPTMTPTMQVFINKTVNPSQDIQSGDSLTYTISFTVTGGGATGLVLTDTLPANLTFQNFGVTPAGAMTSQTGSILTWTMPSPLAPGSYSLTYMAQVNDLLSGGTSIINNASALWSGGGPVSSGVTVTITGQYTVRIGVYNEAGELVKTVLVKDFSQPIDSVSLKASNTITSLTGATGRVDLYFHGIYIGTWDGSNAAGNPSPNGVYTLKIDNIDSLGSVRSTSQQVMVSRTLYETTILVYNETGEVVRHLYAWVDDPGKATITGVVMSSGVIEPTGNAGSTPTQLVMSLSNGVTVTWDGKNDSGAYVGSGQYFVEIHSADGSGGESVFTNQVTVRDVNTSGVYGVVTADPNALVGGNTVTTFKSGSTVPITLRARIYTVAGELVATVQSSSGSNQATWDASGLSSGLYLALVDSLDPAKGGIVQRQVLKIKIVH
ncbi:MAG TPA: isopeptide-forming domain-containing fimbrial protein, partial [bacterium]|nr:isopeptide-forming domain-containing fimbrial protein [bacterium]